MTSNKIIFIFLIVFISFLINDADAGWKFWKKDKKDEVSTEIPEITSSTTIKITTISSIKTGIASKAIAGAADPGLAIGVVNSGTNIKNNARVKQPNPGIDVGLDYPSSKPSTRPGTGGNSGQGYRDYVVDLTGAGEQIKITPKLPSQPPALNPTIVSSSTTQKPSSTTKQSQKNQEEQTQKSTISIGVTQKSTVPIGITQKSIISTDKPQITTLNIGPIIPNNKNPQISITSSTKSWAEIAGNGIKLTSTTPSTNNLITGTKKIDENIYSSNPIYSKGNKVTDDDLEKLSESLFIKDKNNAYNLINLNLQKKTTSNNKNDESPQPLFTINSQVFNIPTISKVITIYDNYKLDSRINEYISPAQRNEESLLVDTFLSTNVMSAAMRFLADKGFIAKDYYAYKDILRQIWFNLYSRGDGKIGSSGFEHVFLTELKLGNEVSGLHNWIYFNNEEVQKRADYLGYMKKIDLGNKAAILKIHAKFNGIDKPVTTLFVGTSPELEMALYTVCFFVRSEMPCPVSLGGTKFNIITHKFKYRGKELIGSAYPDI